MAILVCLVWVYLLVGTPLRPPTPVFSPHGQHLHPHLHLDGIIAFPCLGKLLTKKGGGTGDLDGTGPYVE